MNWWASILERAQKLAPGDRLMVPSRGGTRTAAVWRREGDLLWLDVRDSHGRCTRLETAWPVRTVALEWNKAVTRMKLGMTVRRHRRRPNPSHS
jgi:hypothetical protein